MTKEKQDNLKSKCCNAPMSVDSEDEGTCFYACAACKLPCDPKIVTDNTPSWEIEFDKKFTIRGGGVIGKSGSTYKGDSFITSGKVKSFISNEIAKARTEAIQEYKEKLDYAKCPQCGKDVLDEGMRVSEIYCEEHYHNSIE